MRAEYSAVPIRHQNVGTVDETKADGHLRVPLLHLLQLLEELEVAGHDDGLSGGRYLHGYVQFLLCREAAVRLLLLHIVVGTNLPLVGFKWIYMYVESTCTVRSDVRCGKKCDNVIRSRSTCTAAIILNDFCYRFYSTQEFILHTPCTYGQLRDDMSCTRALTTFSPSPSS